QASNKASTATKEIQTHQNETQVVTHKPEMAQPQVLQTKEQKVVVVKAEETPEKRADKADIQAEQPQEMVLRKAIMPKKVEDKAVNTGDSAPTIHKNSAEYFIAVKNKVADIKQSIRLNSETELQTQLAELGQLSGKESVIYQRMEAYAALKKQRYRQAANSYRKLLNQKPEDMEANMNLVIALAELGDQQVAKQQLNRLDSLYPESSQLKQYKKMIHAKYGY
ncbi:MAG: tetratricopeptide repeat protein, partial [Thiomicrorhabdus sp.]|nr:tetratricopeptide repeat protein [Thiomicrorhabdus sp.]